MKKIIIVIFSFVFLSSNVFAKDKNLNEFNEWLYQSGNDQYINIEQSPGCKKLIQKHGLKVPKVGLFDEPKVKTNEWFWLGCHKFQATNNLKIKFYDNRSEIPEKVKPNYDTLLYFYWRYTNRNWNINPKYTDIKASENPYKFKSDLREDDYIKKQMQKTALLSYLLFEDGKIVVDEISPKDKFGKVFTNETKFQSQSVGKSFASYILGHAICKGYVGGIDAQLNDWPLLENTLYHNQKIIDLINMKAGDGNYFSSRFSNEFKNPSFGYSTTNRTIPSVMRNEFNNSKKSGNKWDYNNLLPHIILNYIIFKASDDGFKNLLDHVFREKAGIEYNTILVMTEQSTDNSNEESTTNTFLTTRYDYLRIARAMLQDWQNDTCEGKYLKSLYERKIKKNYKYSDNKQAHRNTKSYGGFFHLEPSGMKDRHIFIMDGYGGQTLTIDFDTGRIVTTLAVHRDFNWMKIAHSVIKKGK